MAPDNDQDIGQELIDRINAQHLWERRALRGLDLNDYVQQLIEWEEDGRIQDALTLLHEIIDVTHTLVQYDSREPQAYWATKAASLHLRANEPELAAQTLARWLAAWPLERGKQLDRPRVAQSLQKIRERHLGGK